MINQLMEAAKAARAHAYAPYSGYRVGAALLDEQGRIWAACNVENVSYGMSLCAERNAVTAMVSNGGSRIVELLLMTSDGATPCGACLQVLSEFTSNKADLSIHLADTGGVRETVTLRDLFPRSFASSEVGSNAK